MKPSTIMETRVNEVNDKGNDAVQHTRMQDLRSARTAWVTAALAVFLVGVSVAQAQDPDLFRPTPIFAVGNGPPAIVSCDLNEDGIPDVLTANEALDEVAVLLSDGLDGFWPQVR